MLTELRVRDLGVIDDLTLEFGPGMTALTGETGAGKTLVVEALSLVLGGRADPALVRHGAKEAIVEARFVLPTGDTALAETDCEDPDEEREVVLARSLPAAGRSRAWVDGRMASVGALAEAGRDLVDIHGQHDHQSLLSPSAQRRVLDEFAGSDLEPRRALQRRLATIDERLLSLGGDERERARRLDVLDHQVAEIDAASVDDPDEEAALEAEETRLAGLADTRLAAAEAAAALAGGDGSFEATGAIDLLGTALNRLEAGAFEPWRTRLRDALAEVGDVARDLRRAAETWEDDPERLAEVQERRRRLGELRRKYGTTLIEVMEFAGSARKEREALLRAAEEAEILTAERQEVEEALREREAELRRVRTRAAPLLAEAAGARLADLAMAGARFGIEVDDRGAGDGVRFLLGANRGEAMLPLARVASGGELARAMLALRLVARGGPGTMVFDEVDAGVGGRAALALGRALRDAATGATSGNGRQVLVVTHLAQVAAFADHQIAVRKDDRQGRTVTTATEVAGNERVVELARMLSGHPDSQAARHHAEELLATAQG